MRLDKIMNIKLLRDKQIDFYFKIVDEKKNVSTVQLKSL